MSWVLIVILWSGPNPIAMERFPNKESCEAARKWIESKSPNVSVCLEDIKK